MAAGRWSYLPGFIAIAAVVAIGGCAREDGPSATVIVPPSPDVEQPLAPEESRRFSTPVSPSQSRYVSTDQVARSVQPLDGTVPQPVRLVFQCADDVTFAVRMAGDALHVYPPNLRGGFLPLVRQPAESGILYTITGAEFRSDGDLATLQLGDEHYVDCVANPAAAVWESEASRNLLE